MSGTFNHTITSGGAYFMGGLGGKSDGEWKTMDSAPRDGTIIEVRCTYGVAPWYGLFRWSGEEKFTDHDGATHTFMGQPRWQGVPESCKGFTDDHTFMWRPYTGNAVNYVDPTGGFQNDPRYWQQAVAAKYGLPKNTFEKPWWKFW